MSTLDSFTPRNTEEKVAMELSNQLCFEGNELFKQERFQEALEVFRDDLQLCGEVCGNQHSYFANSLYDMGGCYYRLGQYGFALVMFSRACAIHEIACGSEHRLVARDLDGMAYCLRQTDQYERALELRQRDLDIVEKNEGSESARAARSLGEIAILHRMREHPEQAIPVLRRKLAIEEQLGVESAQIIDTVIEIAESYEQFKQFEHALPLRQRVLAHYEGKAEADGSKNVVSAIYPLALCLGKLGRRDLALSMLQRAVEMNRSLYECENQETARLFSVLSDTYYALEDVENALKVSDWGIRIRWNAIGTADEELHKGAMDGDLNRFQKALKHGAAVDAQDRYGRTALIEASTHGCLQIAELLIGLGADVHHADVCQRTALSSSVSHGHAEVFELLLRHGADTDAPGEEGRSLLMESCINDTPLFERLLELSPDLERRDRYGMTALLYAAEWGRLKLVDALIERGAEVNATDGSRRTALMLAARGKATQSDMNYPAIVRLLLVAGADFARSDWSDKTALDYAREGDEFLGRCCVQEGVAEFLQTLCEVD